MFKKLFQISLVLVVLLGLMACSSSVKNSGKTSLLTNEIGLEEVPATEYVYYKGRDGKTVLALLEEVANVEKEDVDGGVYVKSIDGVSADYVNLKEWVYYVDGAEMTMLSDQYVTKDGQVIEWWYGGKKL